MRGSRLSGQLCRACASWRRCREHAKGTRDGSQRRFGEIKGRVLCGGIDRTCVSLHAYVTQLHREGESRFLYAIFCCGGKRRGSGGELIESGTGLLAYCTFHSTETKRRAISVACETRWLVVKLSLTQTPSAGSSSNLHHKFAKKMSLPSSRTVTNHKSYDDSSPSAPSSRRASKITVEYHKPSRQSIQEYQELLSNVNIHAAAAASYKDPFVPTRQAPPPPSSHNSSKSSSRSRDRDSSVSHHKSRNSLHKQPPRSRGRSVSTAPTTIHEADSDPFSTAPSTPQQEFSSFTLPSTREMATSSVPPTPPRPSRANTVNLTDLYPDPNTNPAHGSVSAPLLDPGELYGDSQSFVTAASSTAFTPSPSVAVTSFSPAPVDRMGTVSRSRSGTVTAKGKKGMLGFMTDFLNSNKRPEISTPYDPVHLTHVGFNSSTGEFTGLPKEWQQLLQDSGISKSDQEKNPLAVMEIVKFYQEGGGDVWDKMGHAPAPGGSQSPPIPGTAQPFPGLSKSVDDNYISPVSVSTIPHSRNLTVHSGRRYRFRKRSTPAALMVLPRLTHQRHIALRLLHRSLRSLISTGLILNEQCPSRLATTHSSAQTLQRTGALRGHRRLPRRPENHPTPRLRILHSSHKLL